MKAPQVLVTGVPFGLDHELFDHLRDHKISFEFAQSTDFTIDSLFSTPVDILVIGFGSFRSLEEKIRNYKHQTPRSTIVVIMEPGRETEIIEPGAIDGILFEPNLFNQLEMHMRQHVLRARLSDIIENQQTILDQQRRFIEDTNLKLESWVVSLEKDFSLINTIQESLIPKRFPKTKSFQFQGYFRAGESAGGDFFDVFPFRDRPEIGLVQLDSVGHSVTSSLITALLKVAVTTPQDHPKEVFENLVDSIRNHIVPVLKKTGKAVTMRVGMIDPHKLTFEFADFGFSDFCHFSSDTGELASISHGKNALFASDEVFEDFSRHRLQLKAGDSLLLSTDGCKIAIDAMEERFKTTQNKPILEIRNELAFFLKKESVSAVDDASFVLVKVDDHALQLIH